MCGVPVYAAALMAIVASGYSEVFKPVTVPEYMQEFDGTRPAGGWKG